MTESVKQEKPIVVEFNPGFMLASMDLWRKSLDMQMPIADEFKIHFMTNRRRLLDGFVATAKAWKMLLRDMKVVDESAELDLEGVRLEVQVFLAWAEDGLKALDDLSPLR
jgi:hypothetical protein